MKRILLAITVLFPLMCIGQNADITINEKVFGTKPQDSIEIRGLVYEFPDNIYKYYLDTMSNFLTIQFRGLTKNQKKLNSEGYTLQYDMINKGVLWKKDLNYNMNHILQDYGSMFFTGPYHVSCLDIETGEKKWKTKNRIYVHDSGKGIVLSYKYNNIEGPTNYLECNDINSGNSLWERSITREYGWNDFFFSNDSTVLIISSGIHALNIKTGRGWNYYTTTGVEDYTTNIAMNAAGIALGALTGTYVLSSAHNVVTDIVSNTLVDSTSIYIASKDRLAKLNKNTGEIIWQQPFADKLASKSSIFISDSILYMINYGYAYMGSRQIEFGKPFIAAFNKDSGEQEYIIILDSKDDFIIDYKIVNNEFNLMFQNKLSKYSIATGNHLKTKEFETEKDKNKSLNYFVGNNVFVTTSDNKLVSLNTTDSATTYVFHENRIVLAYDNELNISDSINIDNLYLQYSKANNYSFINKDNKTIIVNETGNQIAELEVTSNAYLLNNTLYNVQGNNFIVIDLKEIIAY